MCGRDDSEERADDRVPGSFVEGVSGGIDGAEVDVVRKVEECEGAGVVGGRGDCAQRVRLDFFVGNGGSEEGARSRDVGDAAEFEGGGGEGEDCFHDMRWHGQRRADVVDWGSGDCGRNGRVVVFGVGVGVGAVIAIDRSGCHGGLWAEDTGRSEELENLTFRPKFRGRGGSGGFCRRGAGDGDGVDATFLRTRDWRGWRRGQFQSFPIVKVSFFRSSEVLLLLLFWCCWFGLVDRIRWILDIIRRSKTNHGTRTILRKDDGGRQAGSVNEGMRSMRLREEMNRRRVQTTALAKLGESGGVWMNLIVFLLEQRIKGVRGRRR